MSNGNGNFQLKDFDYVELGHFVHQHLENAGSKEMAINGAAGIQFVYTVPTSMNLLLMSLHGMIYDGVANEANTFGGIAALTNGCQVYIKNPSDSVVYDFLDGEEIKVNADWGMLCGADVKPLIGAASALGYSFTWNIAEQAMKPVRLREGYQFIVKIQDDLSANTSFQCAVSGLLVPDPPNPV